MPEGNATGQWWRGAVIYQIYIRSFADGNGDGIGDISGLRSRLPYLVSLGVDGVWINPWYPSPLADGGYDVADYRAIHPLLGTLDEAEALIADAHDAGLRVLLDLVPNHTSDQHAWFQAALAAGPGTPQRQRYHFHPGRGPDGSEPPNNWRSVFGGPAWTRATEPDGRPGHWYLHLFDPGQPDLNWDSEEVRNDFDDTLRFWFDLGVDGFRIDVAHALVKDREMRDLAGHERSDRPARDGTHPFWDREEVHDVYRRWRAIADSYDPPRYFIAEAWVDTPQRLAQYVRGDELHNTFNFALLEAPWQAAAVRDAITTTVAEHQAVGAPAAWVLSNHDVARHPSRYARDQDQIAGHNLDHLLGLPADHDLGATRARAATLLMLALPGSAYLYQGEELGLAEVEDLPENVLTDPTWRRSGHTVRGRDGCRVPIPWSEATTSFGFSPDDTATPWLPQPPDWKQHAVTALEDDPASILNLYRQALRLRRDLPALGAGTMLWHDAPDGTLLFERTPGLLCATNLSPRPVALPDHTAVLLTSTPLTEDRQLPPDTTAWLTTDH
jgi:alpha-glucosidase